MQPVPVLAKDDARPFAKVETTVAVHVHLVFARVVFAVLERSHVAVGLGALALVFLLFLLALLFFPVTALRRRLGLDRRVDFFLLQVDGLGSKMMMKLKYSYSIPPSPRSLGQGPNRMD